MRRLAADVRRLEVQQARVQADGKRVQVPEVVAHDLAHQTLVLHAVIRHICVGRIGWGYSESGTKVDVCLHYGHVDEGGGVWETRPPKSFEVRSESEPSVSRDDVESGDFGRVYHVSEYN